MNKKRQRIHYIAIVSISVISMFANPVFATSYTQDELINKGVDAYEINGGCIPGGAAVGIQAVAATVQTVNGTTLGADIVNAVKANRTSYEQAAQQVDLPWQVLAAIHYRESSLNPNKDLQAGNPIGGPYTQFSDAYLTYGGFPKTLQESALIAGKELQAKALAGLFKKKITAANPDPELIKDALFGYNGRAKVYAEQAASLGFDPVKQPYEGSPYVMNNFDDKHRNMGIITKDFGAIDGIDNRLGAYTLYVALGGSTAGSGVGCGGVVATGSLTQLVQQYAWPTYHKPNEFNAYIPPGQTTAPYKIAVDAAQKAGQYVGGSSPTGDHPGVDCGAFVTLLMRNSNTDPTYNKSQGNVIVQQQYMDTNPAKYQKITPTPTHETDLKTGDIYIAPQAVHTYIYVGPLPGWQYTSASASIDENGNDSWRMPMSSPTYFESGNSWYRLIH